MRNPRRKLKSKIWSQNLGVFASAGSSTKNLRRRWRIWFQERTSSITLNWTNVVLELKDPNTGIPITVNINPMSITKTNRSKIIERWEWQTGILTLCLGGGKDCKPKIKAPKCIKIKSANTHHRVVNGSNQGVRNLAI
jgi:hypothetical protein